VAYSQFHDGFWTDPEIRKLSPDEKIIFIWFITNPSRHYSGLYFFEFGNISRQIGLPDKIIRKGIDTLSKSGFIKYNQLFSMVWVRKMARYEVRRGEKTGLFSALQTKGISNHFKTLHNCPLIQDFLAFYPELEIPYQYPIVQEEVEVEVEVEIKVKKEAEDIAPPGPSDAVGAVKIFSGFYACKYFEVDLDYRLKLAKEYPAVDDALLRKELSKAEDWISDNAHKKKFKANGQLANPKLFIKNWLDRLAGIVGPGSDKPKGFAAVERWAAKEAAKGESLG
jgi:hypothetical protein